MKTFILFLVLLFTAYTFKLQQNCPLWNKAALDRPPNLGFSNYTDPSVSNDQLRTIINFINAAAGFYKDDVLANIKYIK